MTPTVTQWAMRNGVSPHALAELAAIMGHTAAECLPDPKRPGQPASEAYAQSMVRLEGARLDVLLFRNNVGALLDERGIPVRYGLANDSAAMNKRIKSADLIGVRKVRITPAHVGSTIGQFVSREIKHAGWTYRGDAHEEAQQRWLELVAAYGGDAAFATGPGSFTAV